MYNFENDSLTAYLNNLRAYNPITRAEEFELARCWVANREPEVAHRLARANLRIVVKLARQYRGYGLSFADIIAEGNIGLLEALKRFDPERGQRLTTYATYWIRSFILMYIFKNRSIVKCGGSPKQSRLFFRLSRERTRLIESGVPGAEITQRLAEHFNVPPRDIERMWALSNSGDASLDSPIAPGAKATHLDSLVDDTNATPESALHRRRRDVLVRQKIAAVRRGFDMRERFILDNRLWCDGCREMTLAEIGRALSLSRERVRQLEARIKEKLRQSLESVAHPHDLTT